METETAAPELIPALPEHLALECLLRLPFHALRAARNVSKKWKEEITSPSFYRLRKAAGFACPVVAILFIQNLHPPSADVASSDEADFSPSYTISLFEPITAVWTQVPAIPGRSSHPMTISYMVAVEHELVLIANCVNKDKAFVVSEVHLYNIVAGTWRQGKSMPLHLRRYSAAYAAGPRAVFIAGGNNQCHRCLKSALSYDVAADEWVRLPDMARPIGMHTCRGEFAGGAFRVLQYDSYDNGWRSGDEFDVAAGRWKKTERKIEKAICVAAAPEGKEYMCRDRKRKLEVLKFVSGGGGGGAGEVLDAHGGTADGWRTLGVLPRDSLRPTYMLAWDGGLAVFNRRVWYVCKNARAAAAAAAGGKKYKWKRIEWSNDLPIVGFPTIFQL